MGHFYILNLGSFLICFGRPSIQLHLFFFLKTKLKAIQFCMEYICCHLNLSLDQPHLFILKLTSFLSSIQRRYSMKVEVHSL